MNTNNKKQRKQVCLNLPIEVFNQLKEKANKRGLDNTNYIVYLVQRDQDDMFSKNVARTLNDITCSTEKLLNTVSNNDDKIRPLVIGIRNGVDELWRYLR